MEPISVQLKLANNSNNVNLNDDVGDSSSPDHGSSTSPGQSTSEESKPTLDQNPSAAATVLSDDQAPSTSVNANNCDETIASIKSEEPELSKASAESKEVIVKRPLVRGGKGIKKDGPNETKAKPRPRAKKKIPLAMYHSQVSN